MFVLNVTRVEFGDGLARFGVSNDYPGEIRKARGCDWLSGL
jgi:hypothetical protein